MQYNLVGVAPDISRVYEIAKVGGFTVKLVTDPENPNAVSAKDVTLFNEFFGFEETTNEADIVAELCFHCQDIINAITSNRAETLADIDDRIFEIDLIDIVVDRTIKGASEALLKKALEKLQIGLVDTLKIIDIAEVIAKMAYSKEIKTEHIAEAIQYKSIAYLKKI